MDFSEIQHNNLAVEATIHSWFLPLFQTFIEMHWGEIAFYNRLFYVYLRNTVTVYKDLLDTDIIVEYNDIRRKAGLQSTGIV